MHGFLALLMKPRNGMPWLPEDKRLLTSHLKHLARILPILGVFALPGSILLLPLLAFYLDRRRKSRRDFPSDDPSNLRDNPAANGGVI